MGEIKYLGKKFSSLEDLCNEYHLSLVKVNEYIQNKYTVNGSIDAVLNEELFKKNVMFMIDLLGKDYIVNHSDKLEILMKDYQSLMEWRNDNLDKFYHAIDVGGTLSINETNLEVSMLNDDSKLENNDMLYYSNEEKKYLYSHIDVNNNIDDIKRMLYLFENRKLTRKDNNLLFSKLSPIIHKSIHIKNLK